MALHLFWSWTSPGGGGINSLKAVFQTLLGSPYAIPWPFICFGLGRPRGGGGGGINSLKAVFQTLLGSPYAIPWPFICFGLGRPRGEGGQLSTDASQQTVFCRKLTYRMRVIRIRNERIRGTKTVGEISKKVQESRLKWYGHVLRSEDECVGNRVMGMEVPGKRRRGRPKTRWLDNINNDLSVRELSGEDVQDRAKWRRLIGHIDPT